ncbi:hypothetical protein [Actinomyces urogenitalis]|uniref:hypothetical protein n=1 Tax=Actinomyces urogenitalis TaxID=103621 RepID=UPI001898D957|nr:hypothetical protein [Actinomyces urogenitalis]
MRRTPKGNTVPEAGDSLLATWPTSLDALGTIVAFTSTSAMCTALDSARAAGSAPTPATPWYGDIRGVLWRADGTRTSSGAWALAPVSEVQWSTASGGGVGYGDHTLPRGGAVKVTGTTLPVAPYDRVVMGIGSLWARMKSGMADVELRMNGQFFKARIPDVDDGNVTVAGMAVVRAGVTPDFEVCAVAPSGAATMTLVSDEWTRITVAAWPIASQA